MQQRQLRLGDILDDYCPRERRVTNHAVVAMVGEDVKQTRCTTCDAEHEYKHAKVPRQRKKSDTPAALYAQVASGAPKRVSHESSNGGSPHGPSDDSDPQNEQVDAVDSDPEPMAASPQPMRDDAPPVNDVNAVNDVDDEDDADREGGDDEGPVHRPLIRASLPRPEGQQPPQRPIPEFTIRQPGGGRPGRFRPRHQHGGGARGHQFQGGGNRGNGNVAGPSRGPRHGGAAGGRPPMMKRHGPGGGGRKRSK